MFEIDIPGGKMPDNSLNTYQTLALRYDNAIRSSETQAKTPESNVTLQLSKTLEEKIESFAFPMSRMALNRSLTIARSVNFLPSTPFFDQSSSIAHMEKLDRILDALQMVKAVEDRLKQVPTNTLVKEKKLEIEQIQIEFEKACKEPIIIGADGRVMINMAFLKINEQLIEMQDPIGSKLDKPRAAQVENVKEGQTPRL